MRPGVKKSFQLGGEQGVYREQTCLPRNDDAQTLTDLTFSEKLGRDKNSNDKTGIKVASSPYNPNS